MMTTANNTTMRTSNNKTMTWSGLSGSSTNLATFLVTSNNTNNLVIVGAMANNFLKFNGLSDCFIYFVDGCNINPELSGATGMYVDNEFKNPLFIPNTLKNSCLIYNSSSKFFHGFQKIDTPNNVTRKTINFHFTPVDS